MSFSWPADQTYRSQALENGVQIKDGNGNVQKACSLVYLYVVNGGAAAIYLLVSDDAAGPHAINVKPGRCHPMTAAPNDFGWSQHGGEEYRNGIYVAAYTTLVLAIAGGAPDAGNVLLISAGWTAPKITPV
jgi:hypothetical protein